MHTRIPILAIAWIFVISPGMVSTSEGQQTGMIKGQVLDAETMAPIVGASVLIVGTSTGAAADADGEFTIGNLSPGSYTLQIQSIGFETQSQTDVIVRPKRTTFLRVEIPPSAVPVGDIVVRAGYFKESDEQPTSTNNYSTEEIRRAPGSAGDVSRIIMVLPSIAKVNDQVNSLIVRGGNPIENGFYLDNIEIPNINHFPLQGSSGGPIGLLNTDLIADMTFSAGGFSALYGNRLSSIMEVQYRDGNRDEFDGQLDLNFAGFGATTEGPIDHGRGSWILSARRSYLDLIVDAIGIGIAPRYGDYHAKFVYDISPKHRISILGVGADDFVEFDQQQAIDDDNIVFGKYEGFEYATGINWRYLWSHNGYSNTAISTNGTKATSRFYEASTEDPLTDEVTFERTLHLRNVNSYRFNEHHRTEFGVEGTYFFNNYDISVAEYTNSVGDTVPPLAIDDKANTTGGSVFISHTVRPFARLSMTLGLRFDHLAYNKRSHWSPRFAWSYDLTDRTSINGSTGIYYQPLPLVLLVENDAFLDLKDPVAYHYVLGIGHLLTESTRLTLEGYYKHYRHFPLDPMEPRLFISDETVYRFFFGNHVTLEDVGRAESYGIELTIRKKLVEGIYGLLSASLSRSRYEGLDDVWRDRVFDNRALVSFEGGYKPNERWEFSARWIFAGGAPYTPLDLEKSAEINRSVLDDTRVNAERYPDYHSLNLRADRRFNFRGSNLIVYISVWNAYDRRNVAQYFWNEVEEKPDTLYQWSMIPLFGLEFEF